MFVDRNRISYLRERHHRIVDIFGTEPHHRYVFNPRDSNLTVVLSFYYPYYSYGEPSWTGYHHEHYRRPVYYHYGWSPDWISLLVYHVFLSHDYVDRGGSIRNRDLGGVNATLRDIQDAWEYGDINLIADHLRSDNGVHIYFDGEYEYTTSVSDFYAMTADAMSTISITEMRFGDPIWIAPREVYVPGVQEFIDPRNKRQTKHIAYRLRQIGYSWYIVSFDTSSSDEPTRSPFPPLRW